MKICISLVVLSIAGAHAFHDISSGPRDLHARKIDYQGQVKSGGLADTVIPLKTRSGLELSPELVRRGGCASKGCLKTQSSDGQGQGLGQQPQRGRSPQRSQPSAVPEIQPDRTPSPPRVPPRSNSPTRTARRTNSGGSSSSGASDLIPLSQIRLGALARDSPSWRRDRPIRTSSHDAQQFVDLLRNPGGDAPTTESPNNSRGRIPVGSSWNQGTSAASPGSSPPRSRPQESPYNAGA